jgi:DNA-binding NarL/FixJ family response regulator
MSGIESIPRLKQRFPGVLLVMLSVYDDDQRIFEALCAGACGYLLKSTPPARLLESLREVVGGGAPMSPEVARRERCIHDRRGAGQWVAIFERGVIGERRRPTTSRCWGWVA